MKKLFAFLFCMILLASSMASASAWIPPGTGGGENPPLPPLPPSQPGQGEQEQQNIDVIPPFVLIQASATSLPAQSQLTITASVADTGGYNTGVSSFVIKENNNVIFSKGCNNAASCDGSLTFSRTKGSYIYTVDAVDASGNHNTAETTSPSSLTVVFQNRAPTAPTLTAPADNIYVTIANPLFSWTASSDPDNDAITYDIEIDGAIANVNALSYQRVLPEGLHTWRVRAVDSEGLTSAWTAVRTFRTDTLRPQVFNSNISTVELGNNALIRVDIIEANLVNATVEINSARYQLVLQSGNTYGYTLASPSLGSHNVRYYVQDIVGNVNNSVTDSFNVVDITTPLFNPALVNQTVELGQSFVYDVNATDLSLPIIYTIDNANFSIDSQGTITNAGLIPVGIYSLIVSAKDSQNNTASVPLTITVQDTIAPIWNPVPENQYAELGSSFSYQVNADDLQTVNYAINATYGAGTSFTVGADGTISNTTPLALGLYNIQVAATDLSSNANSTEFSVNVTDTIPPEWLEAQNKQMQYNGTLNYQVIADDLQSIVYTIKEIGTEVVTFVINAVTGVITNIITPSLGAHELEVNATDASGNVNSTRIGVFVDDPYSPDSFDLLSPVNNTISNSLTPILTWQQTAEDNFAKYVVQVSRYSDFSSIDNEYELLGLTNTSKQTSLEANIQYFWRVLAYDTSNNIKNSTSTFIYTTDNIAPVLSQYDVTGDNEGIFSPADQNGVYDTINIVMNTSELVDWGQTKIYNSSGQEVKYFNGPAGYVNSNIETWTGGYTETIPPFVLDGVYTINTTITDVAGNANNVYTGTIEIDNTAPADLGMSRPAVIYGNMDVQLIAEWNEKNIDYVLIQHNATGTWQNASVTQNGTEYSATISQNDLEAGDVVGWRSIAEDKAGHIVTTPEDTFNVQNHAPYFATALSDAITNKNRQFSYDVSAYAKDDDNDPLTYSDNATQFDINPTTGIISFIPSVEETINVLITVCDTMPDCVSDDFQIKVDPEVSNIINSNINGTYYANESAGNITGILNSDVIDSSILNIVDVSNSYIRNSTLVDSTASYCTIIDSTLYGINCFNQTIDPSDIRYSNVSGSDITNSHVWNSNATNSNIIEATIDDSNVDNSSLNNAVVSNNTVITQSAITNSTLTNTTASNSTISNSDAITSNVLNNAVISDNTISSGTIVMYNGTVYDASADGAKELKEIVNLAPKANFSYSTSYLAVAFTDLSTDANIFANSTMNDSLTYLWNFGDTQTSTLQNANHTYASAGTYTITLTITDSFGASDSKTAQLTVSAQQSDGGSSSSSSGGGGGGGGGGGCSPKWNCTEWSSCANGNQTRTCTDKWSCGTSYEKPAEKQSCAIETPTAPSNETAGNETNQTEQSEAGEGIITQAGKTITGAVTGVLGFGKENPFPIIVIIATFVTFIVVQFVAPRTRLSRKRSAGARAANQIASKRKTHPLVRVVRKTKDGFRVVAAGIAHHAGKAHKAVKHHVGKAGKAIAYHASNTHKAVKKHIKNAHEGIKNGLSNTHKAVKKHAGNAGKTIAHHASKVHEAVKHNFKKAHKAIKHNIKNMGEG